MSQLFSAFGVTWSSLIAQAVNFGIVLAALWYFLYRPVLAMLEKRKEMVAKGVEEAKAAAQMLSHADADAAAHVKQADEEAENILVAARAAADEERSRIVLAAEVRAEQVAKDAAARATEEVARAKRESERDVARLAILAAEKIMLNDRKHAS